MPHQCVHCGNLYENAAPELLNGCTCGSKFFFYIKGEQYERLKKEKSAPVQLNIGDKKQDEKDVREIIGIKEQEPVILDLESVKVLKPGKFVIDIVNLFTHKRPIIYKLEEGNYIIDLASTLKTMSNEKSSKKKK